MAVHFTIYLAEPAANELRRFMAAHACNATEAVDALLVRQATDRPASVSFHMRQQSRPHQRKCRDGPSGAR